jgi:lysophospholipase L1-like esterase
MAVGGSSSGAGASNGGSAGSAGSAGSGGSSGGSSGSAGSAGSTGGGGTGGSAPLGPVTVYIAGDSTVSTYADTASTTDQAGWGQMLHESFSDLVTIENHAVGGRTSRRFIEEGRLDEILADIEAGDYFLVQFGTNDSNKTAMYELNGQTIPYYLDPNTDFKEYLMQYVDGAREKQATPVLVTPPPRNSAYCTGGNGTGAYAQAMRDLGEAEDIAVADLNQKSVDHLKAICPAPTPEDVFLLRGDGTVDGTHFQENGARLLAGFVAQGIDESGIGLAAFMK